MGVVKERRSILPIFNIFKWADGNQYTVDEDSSIELPMELNKSLETIDEKAKEHFDSASSKGKAGKSKSIQQQVKVEKQDMRQESKSTKKVEKSKSEGKEIVD